MAWFPEAVDWTVDQVKNKMSQLSGQITKANQQDRAISAKITKIETEYKNLGDLETRYKTEVHNKLEDLIGSDWANFKGDQKKEIIDKKGAELIAKSQAYLNSINAARDKLLDMENALNKKRTSLGTSLKSLKSMYNELRKWFN